MESVPPEWHLHQNGRIQKGIHQKTLEHGPAAHQFLHLRSPGPAIAAVTTWSGEISHSCDSCHRISDICISLYIYGFRTKGGCFFLKPGSLTCGTFYTLRYITKRKDTKGEAPPTQWRCSSRWGARQPVPAKVSGLRAFQMAALPTIHSMKFPNQKHVKNTSNNIQKYF